MDFFHDLKSSSYFKGQFHAGAVAEVFKLLDYSYDSRAYETGSEKARETYEAGREKAVELYADGREKASELYADGREYARELPARTADGVQRNPLLALISATAVGLFAGIMLPKSKR